MTVHKLILTIILCAASTQISFCQKTKPYKATLPSNAKFTDGNNAIESFQQKTQEGNAGQVKHPLEIWKDITPNEKESILSSSKSMFQSFLGKSQTFDINTEFTPACSTAFRQVGECVARKDKKAVSAIEFTLPEMRVYNMFRLDLDFPNAANWEEKQDFSNTWFDEISATNIPQIEKAWNDYKRFYTETPKCAFVLINSATKTSKEGEFLCNRTGYIWNVISSENYPISDECNIGSLMIQYHNQTLVSKVQSLISEDASPKKSWELSEEAAIQKAKDYVLEINRANNALKNDLDRILKAKPDVERVMWIGEKIDLNGIVQYVPYNAYSVVFGFNEEWISPYLTDITIDASSGDVLDSSSTSKERRQRFKQLCNNLRSKKALVFE